MMLGGIFSWLVIGVVVYLIFFRRGGMMGCCGGHHHNRPDQTNHPNHDHGPSKQSQEEIIDLKKEDYHVKSEA